ncbi:MAG: 7-cyano-7-deazaguanine synthase QueC [Deltaproteobacteria bacterium]|nr:7-cyano-7-deazaguanine synthase QueC [Deltaproteobacteria bacterium]
MSVDQPAVVLLSGGMDSAVVLAMARAEGYRVHALTVDYGQRHRVELEAAERVAAAVGVEAHMVLEVDLTAVAISALTGTGVIPKSERQPGDDPIPPTYVPARNTLLLSMALSWAESIGARDLFIGVSAVDYSGYPDCRPEFIAAFEEVANRGTRAHNDPERPYRVHAPLLELTKEQTVRTGLDLGLDFGLTWSCYDPGPDGAPCLECDACRLRRKGFDGAGVDDPVRGR